MVMRADLWLVEKKLVASRQKAKELIDTGAVTADGIIVKKASQSLADNAQITIDSPLQDWVSRGALKLIGGLKVFPQITVADKICLDLGASTGGFTDVLLANQAAHVTAIDVGHGQLAEKLVHHPSVTSLEKTNVRYLTADMLPERFHLIVCDLSFISLTIALPAILRLAPNGCQLLALVKPQFEVGRSGLDKGGIVKDRALREQALSDVCDFIATEGWQVLGRADSPITGPDGNHEYLIAAQKIG